MTPTDIMALAALVCCGVGIAGVLWGMQQYADRCWFQNHAKWVGAKMQEFQDKGIRLESELLRIRSKRSRAVSAGNRTRAEKQRALVRAKQEQLQREVRHEA